MDDEVQALLAEQLAYYRAHAPDYDIAYLDNDWDQSIQELPIAGDVLETSTPLLVGTARRTSEGAPTA